MADSTKPEASAVVTREHRIAALTAFGWGAVVGTQNAVADWVEDPTREHGLFSDTLPTLAQAIADAEARGRASRDEEVERLRRELLRARRILVGVNAPCRACGDSIQKCSEAQCCMGCNHAPAFRHMEGCCE
jgi:hypothetical protein